MKLLPLLYGIGIFVVCSNAAPYVHHHQDGIEGATDHPDRCPTETEDRPQVEGYQQREPIEFVLNLEFSNLNEATNNLVNFIMDVLVNGTNQEEEKEV